MISAIVSRIVILLFGTLYPAYASYKAVRTKNVKEYVKWMMYWIVFAFFSCIETITDIFLSWFPFYYEVKIIIVLWLLSPATKGSSTLYRKFVHPMLTKREQEIDEYITQAKEKGYTAVIQLGSKGVNYATNVIMQTALKTLSNGNIRTSQSDNTLTSSSTLQSATITEINDDDITDGGVRMHRSTSVDSALTNKDRQQRSNNTKTFNNNISYNLRSHDVILEGSSDDDDNKFLSQLITTNNLDINDDGAARSRSRSRQLELIINNKKNGKQKNLKVSESGKGSGSVIKGRRRLKQNDQLEMDIEVDVE